MISQHALKNKPIRRRGISLIELMVVISSIAVIGGLAGTTFHLLMKAEKSTSESIILERATSRLAERFRNDVHQAVSGDVIEQSAGTPHQLQLIGINGSQIHYRITKSRISRLVIEGDKISSRDDFLLPDCRLSISAGTASESQMRSLTIERPSAAMTRNGIAKRPLRALTILSYLNQNQQLLTATNPRRDVDDQSSGATTK